MGTFITKVAHGLVADDTIMLANLVGGDGLSENTLYYVLAAGLTADQFAVSESSGGVALTYTTDITDGSVVRTDTYSAIADGVQDPPTTLSAPDVPVLTSTTVSGIIRLFVECASYTDTAIRLRATEVQITHLYSGATPVWEQATVLSLPVGTTSMSIPTVGSTLHAARSRVIDVFGNVSAYSSIAELTTDVGVDSLGIVDNAITATKIADNAIQSAKIAANQITADHLATTILLASLIKTADSGRRIEVDSFGIRLYDSTEGLLVSIPTNGDPVYVKGQVNADSLISQTSAEFRTAASLASSATMTLQNGISAPTQVPALVGSTDYTTIVAPSGISTAAGFTYDPTGGTAGTGSFWFACDPTVSPYYVAQEYEAPAGVIGALRRTITATGSTSTVTTTLGSTSHVSDTSEALATTANTHITTPLTMPRAGTITKVSAWFAGYSGAASARLIVLSAAGASRCFSNSFTATSRTFSNGNDDRYEQSMTVPYDAASGEVIHVGFMRTSTSDGVFWSMDNGSGKSTYSGDGTAVAATGYGSFDSNSKPNVYITYTYTVDTRLETAPNIGIATDGTHVYILDNTGVVWKYLRSTKAYVSKSSVQTAITGTKACAGLFYDSTAAELIITTTTGTGAGVFPKFIRVNASTLAVSSTVYSAAAGTTFSGTTDVFRGGARVADALNGSAATYWLCTTSSVYAYTFAGTVATQTANRDFGVQTTIASGLTHDGTVFRGWNRNTSTKVYKFSAWDWTTASGVYWIGYAWYDSVGTTHETICGPRTSITMRRHERVQITNAGIPTGGVDDPNQVRIYALPGVSDFVAGTAWLQVTDALTARYMTNYTGSGTHDGAGTAFPAGTPAVITSSATGPWALKGDGTLLLPTPAAGPVTSAAISWDAATRAISVGDATRARPITSVGWASVGVGPGVSNATSFSTARTLVANGGASVGQIIVPSPMILQDIRLWNTDATLLRTCVAYLYRDTDNDTSAEFVTGTNATFSFTATVAAVQSANIATPGTVIPPGVYFLVVRNTHATNTFGLGVVATITSLGWVSAVAPSTITAPGATLDVLGVFTGGSAQVQGAWVRGRFAGSAGAP